MKKNTLHKVMATALVGAMAMSTLTGCGSNADTNASAEAGTKESVAESSAATGTDSGSTAAGLSQRMLPCRFPYTIVDLPETDAPT